MTLNSSATRVSGDPDDLPRRIDDYRSCIALGAVDFRVNEEVLQLLASAETQRTKAVSGPPVSDRQAAPASRPASMTASSLRPAETPDLAADRPDGTTLDLGRNRARRLGHRHLPRHVELIA